MRGRGHFLDRHRGLVFPPSVMAFLGGGRGFEADFDTLSGVQPALVLDYSGIAGGQFFANDDNTKTFSDLHAFVRASDATYRDNSGVFQTASSGVHRLTHDKDGNRLGLLTEEERTNIALQSNGFGTTWIPSNAAALVKTDVGPDGLTSMWKLLDDGGGSAGTVDVDQQLTLPSAGTYIFSAFAKADQLNWLRASTSSFDATGNGSSWFDLANGIKGTQDANHSDMIIEDAGNGIYRCSVQFSTTTDLTGRVHLRVAEVNDGNVVDRDDSSSILIFGAQFEEGQLSSYIPTTTVAVTRAGETAPAATSGWDFSATVGSIIGIVTPNHLPADELILFSLNDGTTDEVIEVYIDSSANVRFRVTDGGVDQCDIDSLVNAVAGTELKIGISWAASDFAISVNGATIAVDTGGTLPTVTQLEPGENGVTASLAEYKATLSDADLVAGSTL